MGYNDLSTKEKNIIKYLPRHEKFSLVMFIAFLILTLLSFGTSKGGETAGWTFPLSLMGLVVYITTKRLRKLIDKIL